MIICFDYFHKNLKALIVVLQKAGELNTFKGLKHNYIIQCFFNEKVIGTINFIMMIIFVIRPLRAHGMGTTNRRESITDLARPRPIA